MGGTDLNLIGKVRIALRFLMPAKFNWLIGIRSETHFWNDFLRTKGLQLPADYYNRLDPEYPLEPNAADLLPPDDDVHLLDVGAGPLTYLGKTRNGKRLRITAVDALADEYDELLNKYGVQPPVRTERLDAEDLTSRFAENTFDLGYARNCLDHAYDPEQAVLQMIAVVKKNRYVLLEHTRNEAENHNYSGLHQWNFDMSPAGEFLIRSKSGVVNMSQRYADRCTISCNVVSGSGPEWIYVRILKK